MNVTCWPGPRALCPQTFNICSVDVYNVQKHLIDCRAKTCKDPRAHGRERYIVDNHRGRDHRKKKKKKRKAAEGAGLKSDCS